jgi:predicted GNAT family N-acyltransferase
VQPSDLFVELDKTIHNRKGFDCGTQELNQFLQQFALRHSEAGISKTMVLPAGGDASTICAYYTLTHTEIKRQSLPKAMAKKLPRYPVPVMLIAQLAVHKDAHGQGLRKSALIKALKHCCDINDHLPSYAVVVDALNEGVQEFYKQYGFMPLDHDEERIRLFISMKTIQQLFV